MLLPRALLLVLASALLPVLGQTNSNSQTTGGQSNTQANSQATPSASRTTVTSTSFSLSQSFSGRTAVTVTVPVVVTFVPDQGDSSGPTVPPGNNGEQDNANNTTVDTRTWPTAAKTREGGPGGGTNGAPSPGQNSNGGVYGPPDDYIAAGVRTAALSIGAVLFGVIAVGLI